MFSAINAFLLRPLPVERPEQLVKSRATNYSFPDYLDYRDQRDVFADLALHRFVSLSLRAGERSELVFSEIATGNFFDMLGVRAAHGRTFTPADDASLERASVAIVNHTAWQRRFGGDPELVGKTIVLNNHKFTVIGITPEGFKGTNQIISPDLWVPFGARALVMPGRDRTGDRTARGWSLTGRLQPGVTLEAAQARMNLIAARLAQVYPETNTDMTPPEIVPTNGIQSYKGISVAIALFAFLGLLLGVVTLVLLIACANVANLLLARATTRRKEIAVRLALGASRFRLVRQLLTESLLLALAGGALGLLLASWVVDLATAWRPPVPAPIGFDFSLDWRVFAFTLLLSLATVIVFGLVPALQASKPDLVATLKDEGAGLRFSRAKLRNLLIVGQVAVSLVLLISAGLFIRSLQNSQNVNPGFETHNGLVMAVDLRPAGYGEDEAKGRAFYRRLIEKIEALPGVRSASLADIVPLSMNTNETGITIEGGTEPPDKRFITAHNSVAPRYFETMNIPLLRGREFTDADIREAPPVAIINETMARRFWATDDAIGKRFRFGGADGELYEVVGVARDSKYGTLGEDAQPFMFLPFLQDYDAEANVHVRTESDPRGLRNAVQRAALEIDPTLPAFDVQTIEEAVAFSFYPSRIAVGLLGTLGALGLLLALVGIYGVMSYFVAQRTREIGVRMALGAKGSDVLRFVVWRGMMLVAIGIAIGVGAALLMTGVMRSLLYGVSTTDPVTFISVSLLLAAVALVAILIPARRATKVDPMVALRYE
ncbi:MAG: ABC transporter permease [Acidobacteria bacterium]|nr:ABC transporter permease [Acidobacteriota bacterium]